MKTGSPARTKLSTVDLICRVMDSEKRPLDFGLVLRLGTIPALGALREGARSAARLYPRTRSRTDGKWWTLLNELPEFVDEAFAPSETEAVQAAELFFQAPFDPSRHPPVRQLRITAGEPHSERLVTRFHHAAADLLSAVMWLSHQLEVATGVRPPAAELGSHQAPALKLHASPVQRNPFALAGPSDQLWHRSGRPSRVRKWQSVRVNNRVFRTLSKKRHGFTFNDLLIASILETLRRWNQVHGARRRGVGLWVPVNIRRDPFRGFGNGIGRIRVYATYPETLPAQDQCLEVRRQMAWARSNGHWAVPENHILTRLPLWIGSRLMRCYLRRPGVDVGTSVFSHLERWPHGDPGLPGPVRALECVGQLHARYCLAINAISCQDQTWLTFTYDPALLLAEDVGHIIGLFRSQLGKAERDLK